jgi:hypothetical protein
MSALRKYIFESKLVLRADAIQLSEHSLARLVVAIEQKLLRVGGVPGMDAVSKWCSRPWQV